MRIEVVQLENIRSHVKSTVPFTRGFNCLVGALGSGKSSILYAIDFCLFGESITRSFEYLLREGAESGKITVQFTQDTRRYKLTRGIRRHAKGISQDIEQLKLFENETLLASVKTDAVMEQFRAITGLDRDLWREIIWVKQEHLKELIDAAPRVRQTKLDELFGLSDYETAWSSIAEYKRECEVEREILQKDPDVTGMEKLCTEYNRVTEDFTFLEIQLQDLTAKLSTAKKILEEADSKLKKLEDKKLSVEDLKRKETRLQTSLAHNKEVLASLKERSDGKENVIENLEQRQQSLQDQERTWQKRLEQVGITGGTSTDTLHNILHKTDEELSGLRANKEASTRSLLADDKRIDSLSLENRCPLCLQPLNDEYKNELRQRIKAENTERRQAIEVTQKEIEELQRKMTTLDEAYSSLQMINSKREDLTNRIREELVNLKSLSSELEEKQKLDKEFEEQLNSITFQISRFSLVDLESAKNQREQAFKQYCLADSSLRTKENERKNLSMRMDDIKERVDRAQQKLERMERVSKTIEVIGSIRDAYRGIQPRLRGEFIRVLRNFVQQVLDSLTGETPLLNVIIDETYTPYVKSENRVEREVSNLSGGERTLMAFAYRLGLGQLIMQSRTGHGLSILLLDEPTESLGREDGSIDRLAEAISRFKAIEQIIAVTHSEAFADKAEHVITLEKEAGISKASIEK